MDLNPKGLTVEERRDNTKISARDKIESWFYRLPDKLRYFRRYYFQRLRRAICFKEEKPTGEGIRNLDGYILRKLQMALPEFRERNNGYPLDRTPEEWDAEIDRAIELVNIILDYDEFDLPDKTVVMRGDDWRNQYKERQKVVSDAEKEFGEWLGKNLYHLWI